MAYRRSRSFSRHLRTTRSSSAGTSLRDFESGSGAAWQIWSIVWVAVSPTKGSRPDGQLVEDDAEAEEVGPVVHLLAERLLRAHVGHGAHDEPGLGPGLRLDPAVERGRALDGLAREAEVEQLHLPVRRDHGVGGLDVAVDDAARVGLLQRRGHLLPEVDDPVHVERAAREELAQVLALDVLHGDEVRPVVDADVVDVRDVRVVEGRGGARLALEPLAVDLVDGQLRGQHLDRDGAVEPRVPRPVDLPHAAGARGGEDLVRAEAVPGINPMELPGCPIRSPARSSSGSRRS